MSGTAVPAGRYISRCGWIGVLSRITARSGCATRPTGAYCWPPSGVVAFRFRATGWAASRAVSYCSASLARFVARWAAVLAHWPTML